MVFSWLAFKLAVGADSWVSTSNTYLPFSYESTPSTYITGSHVQSANAGGVKLDISPTAWATTGAAGAVGDITFVYVRVK